MSYSDIYKNLVDNYDLAIEEPSKADKHMYNAFLVLINMTTTEDNAATITNWLFNPVRTAYVKVFKLFQNHSYVLISVYSINQYVIQELEEDLTTFVNNIWPGVTDPSSDTNECVPINWADLCAECGFDISGWNVCKIES